jgi:hypothetical protein
MSSSISCGIDGKIAASAVVMASKESNERFRLGQRCQFDGWLLAETAIVDTIQSIGYR